MIKIEGLQKSFGDLTVLQDINLEIADGEIYGLVGKSGAGKSTLLRCINGLEDYSAGSIKVDGVEIKDLGRNELRDYRKGVSMIFQHFPMLTRKSVYENIAFPMKCWKYPKNEVDRKVRELAELGSCVELASLAEGTAPCEDCSNRVCGGLLALEVLVVVTLNSAVSSLILVDTVG